MIPQFLQSLKGRIVGIIDQRQVTDTTLPFRLYSLLSIGSCALVSLLIFRDSPDSLRLCIAIYGFCNGPCIGYCYDWCNRITYPTELSMAIVMFGVNVGSAAVPFLVPWLWSTIEYGPYCLLYVVLFSMLIPIPIMYLTQSVRYEKDYLHQRDYR